MNDQSSERWQNGLDAVARIYGPGPADEMIGLEHVPMVNETVCHMFGEIWNRPGLSMRDKRLLVIGATTMLGRSDLIATQVGGAIINGELSAAELDEISLLMLFYAGAGNSTALHRGIEAAKARVGSMRTTPAAAHAENTSDAKPEGPAIDDPPVEDFVTSSR